MFIYEYSFYYLNRAELQNDRPKTYLKALEQNCLNQQYNLVLCILNNNRKERYDTLKKFSCMDTVIPSQVIIKWLKKWKFSLSTI